MKYLITLITLLMFFTSVQASENKQNATKEKNAAVARLHDGMVDSLYKLGRVVFLDLIFDSAAEVENWDGVLPKDHSSENIKPVTKLAFCANVSNYRGHVEALDVDPNNMDPATDQLISAMLNRLDDLFYDGGCEDYWM